MRETSSCCVPMPVYQRLRVLYMLERFSSGCYGKVRLQKVAYFTEKEVGNRLFTFRKAPQGPYSEDLADVLEQLLSMGLVAAEPMAQGQGNRYRVVHGPGETPPYGDWLAAISWRDKAAIDDAVERYGYLKQDDLIEAGHKEEAFLAASHFDVLLEANARGCVRADLPPDDCDDLVLSLSPGFVERVYGLAAAVRDFDFAKVPSA